MNHVKIEQLTLIPQLGDTKMDNNRRNRLVWSACPKCGKERWQQLSRQGRLCISCALSKSRKGLDYTWLHEAQHIKLWDNPIRKAEFIEISKISHNTPEYLEKSRNRKLKEWQDPEMRKKMIDGIIESQKDEGFIENARIRQIERWKDPQMRGKITQGIKESHNTPEYIEKIRIRKTAEWQDPEQRDKMIKSILEMNIPNSQERMVQKILDKNYPNEWKFVGDGTVILNGLSPDFINVNGKKMIIEYFGEYWHKPHDEVFKIKKYAEYGYKTLVIWSNKVHGKHDVEQKIIEWVKANA